MSERTYLQENEIEVLICLLKVYSRALRKEEPRQIRREEIPEIFLEGGILDLSGRKSLSSSEDRLLGQLSVIKFRTKSDAEPVSLLNFPKCMPISIIRLPQQRKLGDEKHNNRLYSARIKTVKKWIEHLPGSFNDELISNLFLQIKDDRVETAVKKYYNKNRRLSSYDASCLKGFAGLSDKQYMRFSRAFYYFTGIRILAPIKDIQLLRKAKAEQDYTTMHTFVVTMYRVTKQDGGILKRAIPVGVVTIRPNESIANSAHTLLSEGKLLPSEKRFKPPFRVPASVEDVILYKFGMDKGGGSVKLIWPPPQASMVLMDLTRASAYVNYAISDCSDLQWPCTTTNCMRYMSRKRVRPGVGKNKINRATVTLTTRLPREETNIINGSTIRIVVSVREIVPQYCNTLIVRRSLSFLLHEIFLHSNQRKLC